MGHPLSQTLFTCLYMERLVWPQAKTLERVHFSRDDGGSSGDDLLSKVLRCFCIASLKACHLVRSMITSTMFFEVRCESSQILPTCTNLSVYRKKTSHPSSTIESF